MPARAHNSRTRNKQVEIPLSSGEEKDVDMYMAISTSK